MTEYVSKSIEETKVIAKKILEVAEAKGVNVIALQGDLGAGKTALTKCIAEALGVEEIITSPTFVIMKKYGTLIHIDAYRLNSAIELGVLGFTGLIKDKNNLIVIEWPERVAEILPEEKLTVQCDFLDEMTRKYSF